MAPAAGSTTRLRALRRCAQMQAVELKPLAVDALHRDLLDRAIEDFDAAVHGAKPGRDILEHFDEYACGEGRLQRDAMRELGPDVFEAAAMFWGGDYTIPPHRNSPKAPLS